MIFQLILLEVQCLSLPLLLLQSICSLHEWLKVLLAPLLPLLLNPWNKWKKSKTPPWGGHFSCDKMMAFTPNSGVNTRQGLSLLHIFFPNFFPSAFSTGDIKVKQKVQQVLTSGSLGFCFASISRTGCRSRTSWGNRGRKRLYPLT